MNKKLEYLIDIIVETIVVWLMLKYTSYETTVLTLLIQIYCRMLIKIDRR